MLGCLLLAVYQIKLGDLDIGKFVAINQ